jgi:hypothetical protein
VLTNLLAILNMTSCGSGCYISSAVSIYWGIFALGIVSALIGGFFFTVALIYIGGVNDRFYKAKVLKKNYGNEFFNEPFDIFALMRRGLSS